MIRVFLVDDHEIVRRGIEEMLNSEADMTVIGEAGTVHQALGRIAAVRPDIAVLDVRLPDGNGIDLCREVLARDPGMRCLILTAFDDDDALVGAVIAGASGYVTKDIRGAGLVDAIRTVAAGGTLMNPAITGRVTQRMRAENDKADPRFGSLSLRERQILALIADGLTNRQIGDQLGLAEKTVKNYVSSLLSKLGLERRTQAAILQVQHRAESTRPSSEA